MPLGSARAKKSGAGIFVRGSTYVDAVGTSLSVTCAIPTNTQVGDYMVAHVCTNNSGFAGSLAATGWTQRQVYSNTDYLFTKTATSGDISAGSVTFSGYTGGGSSAYDIFACIVSFANAAGLDTTGYLRQSTGATTYTYPSITPTVKGDAIFLANRASNGSSSPTGSQFPLAAPSGGTAIIQKSLVKSGPGGLLAQVATDVALSTSATAYSITQLNSIDVGFIAAVKSK